MKIVARLEKSKNFWFLLITSFVLFLLRLPSLFEPYWYGDEGVYQVIGLALRSGRLLYRDIFDNKPPLLYLVYALFNSDQFLIRLASLIFGVLSIIVFFFLAKKIFTLARTSVNVPFLTTILFAFLFGIPFLEGNIANAENFMILPILIAALLIIDYKPSSVKKTFSLTNKFLIIGLLLGIAFLFKIVAVFDLGAFLVFWVYLNFSKIKDFLKKTKSIISDFEELLLLLLGFFIPIGLTSFFFLLKGAFGDFLKAVLSSNIGYVGYANNLGIPQGFLLVKLALLFTFLILIFFQRNKFKPTTIFVLLWFGFSLFNAFFSGRPYTHYLLILLPSFSLMFGFLFLANTIKKISFALITISTLLIVYNFSFFGYKKTADYYKNFAAFIAGQKTVSSYRSFFDKKTPIDYELVQFINSRKSNKDQVFIWGNNAQVYKMIGILPPGKYIVEYHIVGYKDGLTNTQLALQKTKPKFIVIMPNSPSIPFSLINYSPIITISNIAIYERIF